MKFVANFLTYVKERDIRMDKLESEYVEMKKIRSQEDKIDENDAYERKETVTISGNAIAPVDEDEHCATLTYQLFKDHLIYVVSPNVISVMHRLGEKRQLMDRPVVRSL